MRQLAREAGVPVEMSSRADARMAGEPLSAMTHGASRATTSPVVE
jgi:hypothetical protein